MCELTDVLTDSSLKSLHSLIARVDDKELVGICLNTIITPDDIQRMEPDNANLFKSYERGKLMIY